MGNPLLEVSLQVIDFVKTITWEQVVDVVTHAPQYYVIWWKNLLAQSPQHVIIETTLIVFIIWLLFVRKTVDPRKVSDSERLSPKEMQWLIDTWQPDPLVPALSDKEAAISDSMLMIDEVKSDHTLVIRGVSQPVLNASSFDFLGIGRDPAIKEVSMKAMDHYGVGSCGPRGFYGTIDQHLFLEQALAEFIGAHEAIIYSDGAAATSSAIPAFAKKGDLLIVDEACFEPVMTGVNLSRSTVRYFRHNDMEDLRNVLEAIRREDIKLRRDTTQQRRFIVIEGIYRNTGNIAPLDEIMKLREEFFYRVICDETLSFGVLGATGRGLSEHFNVPPMEVDVTTFTLETVLASCGGVCVGTRDIVDHQRLSGAGYCFSASSAPFLAAAAREALSIMQSRPELREKLIRNVHKLRTDLSKIPQLQLVSHDDTPVIHLALAVPPAILAGSTPQRATRSSLSAVPEPDWKVVMNIASECVNRGVGITTNKYGMLQGRQPTLIINANAAMENSDLVKIVKVLTAATKACVKGY